LDNFPILDIIKLSDIPEKMADFPLFSSLGKEVEE